MASYLLHVVGQPLVLVQHLLLERRELRRGEEVAGARAGAAAVLHGGDVWVRWWWFVGPAVWRRRSEDVVVLVVLVAVGAGARRVRQWRWACCHACERREVRSGVELACFGGMVGLIHSCDRPLQSAPSLHHHHFDARQGTGTDHCSLVLTSPIPLGIAHLQRLQNRIFVTINSYHFMYSSYPIMEVTQQSKHTKRNAQGGRHTISSCTNPYNILCTTPCCSTSCLGCRGIAQTTEDAVSSTSTDRTARGRSRRQYRCWRPSR